MTKNNDSQDKDKKIKGGARRRPGGGKSFMSQFQWDSVDDQAQEDLIVPTSSPRRKSAKTSRRRDKDVGTMYVVSSDDIYSTPKKKSRPAPNLEAIANFVADIEEDEEDGFSTPSYGRTKLTRDDEELVEELSVQKEKPAPRPKRARKYEVADHNDGEMAPRNAKNEPREKNAVPKRNERNENNEKKDRREREERSVEPRSNVESVKNAPVAAAPAKRSFLSKIKEAISTGSISREREETAVSNANAQQIPPKKMRWLTQNAKKVLDATGVSSEKIDAQGNGRSQLEELTDLIEALIQANLTLIQSAQTTLKTSTPESNLPQKSECRPVRTVEEIFNDVETTKTPENPQKIARPSRSEHQERQERPKQNVREERLETREQPTREQSANVEQVGKTKTNASGMWDAFADDDFDPIARWENMPDDDEDGAGETTDFSSAERGSNSTHSPDDFDDWNDEVASKKKSERIRKESEKESLFEAPTSELTAVENDAETTETTAENAEEPPKPLVKSAKKSRGSRRESRAEKFVKKPASFGVSSDEPEEFDAFDAVAEVEESPNTDAANPASQSAKPLEKFGDLTLTKPTLKALQTMGYVAPTPIQSGTIPRIQAGVDLMGQAQTGTGKTAAFMIPIVEGVAACGPSRDPLALAVVPTRELAVQVRDETQRLAQFRDMNIVACYGGKPIASQVEKIRRGVDILVGTPGRIIDLTNRGALSLAHARWVVLDEADRMLDIGFRPDVEKILRKTPDSRQTLLFSATLAPPVVRLAKTYMKEPEQYDFSQRDVAADTIEQFYVTVDQDRKYDALVRLLETQDFHQAIVFCRTKRHVDTLGRRLESKFKNVEAIHGDLPQSKRDHIMTNFRAEKTKILVATDVVGRGIDVSTVSHIVNYDVPQYCDDYVHRVGRAGRMGREGVAFTLVTTEEGAELTRIEIRINRLLKRMELPGFEAYSKPVEGPGSSAEPERFAAPKPVFGKSTRRVRRAL